MGLEQPRLKDHSQKSGAAPSSEDMQGLFHTLHVGAYYTHGLFWAGSLTNINQ